MKKIDITGAKFGRLTVVQQSTHAGNKIRWECQCACGARVHITSSNLRSGHTLSCGCLNREINSARAVKRNTRHGHNRAGKGNQSATWHSWASMRKRCSLKSHRSYKDYGGRGIKICPEWDSFENFLSDMGARPDGKTLDRIDVNGDYRPDNCRWATLSEQQRNKRKFGRPK